jgi:hypothetical protein
VEPSLRLQKPKKVSVAATNKPLLTNMKKAVVLHRLFCVPLREIQAHEAGASPRISQLIKYIEPGSDS